MAEPLALWGGLECTIVRIGDAFRDQARETGHWTRPDDLAAIAALGIRTLRYPVLWESVSPEGPESCDWSWHDERLAGLRDLGIAPIAGLVHHGSGPAYTDLLDPLFGEKLAVHARGVAERYPWIEMFTPVNEPLTTARFSGLYGHWYPHGTGYGPFLQALVNQVRAVRLAMKAIREVTPGARLVQTEDLGKTFSTPLLAYQAGHENERRWLGFDLLCGRVEPGHAFWDTLLGNGVPEAHLAELAQDPCPPDIIGINHYLTSERYLDEAVDRYPPYAAGGNGWHSYADVEAVRVRLPEADRGPAARMREAWHRYGLPLAVTEAHLGCTRDEQLRWLSQVWQAAETVRAEGVDMRAVTIWSLFGAIDWNSLLTRRTGFYEPGAFDIRGAQPRRTALAHAAASLARTGRFHHPVLDGPAWWDREDRFYGGAPLARTAGSGARSRHETAHLLIIGDGRLGRATAAICEERGLPAMLIGRPAIDPSDPERARAAIEDLRPWAVVNCCGFPSNLPAEAQPDRCFADNVLAASALAEVTAAMGIGYAVLSTDRVFDGARSGAYVESDPVKPLGLFGETKARGEVEVERRHEAALILRTGPLFGAGDPDMLARSLREALRAAEVGSERDLMLSPTYIPDLVHAMLDLLIDRAHGLWHLVNAGEIDGQDLLQRAGLPVGRRAAGRADGVPARTLAAAGERRSAGRNLVMTSERALLLPPLSAALDHFGGRRLRSAAE